MSRTHNCQVPECETTIRARFLFCHEHWLQLPRSLQDAINDEYRTWQETGQEEPTVRYQKAGQAAIAYIAEKGGETT